ncbi:putative BEST plant protein match is: (TAIR:plant.1) protein [Melia azedarach]|uniref:BEST plant protein match is: (TAIR:plant.1) protein n=1 Tax=Melia azedarach TaxID=155640 RepID=A0ACC1XYA0_MELAZ|nr:putative BEST plant protein match is: (TAIR:plant.1) protein [Melia azedarach]
MACINVFNNEHSMDPRISFSNDFADTQKQESNYREAPVSSDFEFSARNFSMIPADEIFFKGMMMPSKDNYSNQMRKMTTLREELLAGDDGYDNALPRVPKSSGWWKERLGLKRAHIVAKKTDRNDGVLEEAVEENQSAVGKTIQELLVEGGLN